MSDNDKINEERANKIANSLSTPEGRMQLAADIVAPIGFYAELNPSLTIDTVQSLTIDNNLLSWHSAIREAYEAYEVSSSASDRFNAGTIYGQPQLFSPVSTPINWQTWQTPSKIIQQEEEVLNDWLFFCSLRKEEREFQKVKNAINNSIEQMEV